MTFTRHRGSKGIGSKSHLIRDSAVSVRMYRVYYCMHKTQKPGRGARQESRARLRSHPKPTRKNTQQENKRPQFPSASDNSSLPLSRLPPLCDSVVVSRILLCIAFRPPFTPPRTANGDLFARHTRRRASRVPCQHPPQAHLHKNQTDFAGETNPRQTSTERVPRQMASEPTLDSRRSQRNPYRNNHTGHRASITGGEASNDARCYQARLCHTNVRTVLHRATAVPRCGYLKLDLSLTSKRRARKIRQRTKLKKTRQWERKRRGKDCCAREITVSQVRR